MPFLQWVRPLSLRNILKTTLTNGYDQIKQRQSLGGWKNSLILCNRSGLVETTTNGGFELYVLQVHRRPCTLLMSPLCSSSLLSQTNKPNGLPHASMAHMLALVHTLRRSSPTNRRPSANGCRSAKTSRRYSGTYKQNCAHMACGSMCRLLVSLCLFVLLSSSIYNS